MSREILHRCTDCGKWSFAKTRPLRHERLIPDVDEDEAKQQGYEIASGEAYSHEIETGAANLEGTRVWCGPFESWVAERL